MLLWENRKNTLFIFCEGYKSSCKVSNRNIFEFHTVVRNELLKYFRVGFNVRKLNLIKNWWKISLFLILPLLEVVLKIFDLIKMWKLKSLYEKHFSTNGNNSFSISFPGDQRMVRPHENWLVCFSKVCNPIHFDAIFFAYLSESAVCLHICLFPFLG